MANIVRAQDNYIYHSEFQTQMQEHSQYQNLMHEVNLFQNVCSGIADAVRQGKYTTQSANEESVKLECAFQRLMDCIESRQVFYANKGELQERAETVFAHMSFIGKMTRNSMINTLEVLGNVDPKLNDKRIDIVRNEQREAQTRVYVHYNGKGDLFVRGENAHMRMPLKETGVIAKPVAYGVCEILSWDRGLPMTRLADHLWTATFINKKGQIPECNYLIHDCVWPTNPNYSLKSEKSLIHVPKFESNDCSLFVPMDVGVGNKLALFGEGEIEISGKRTQLSWENGVEFTNLGPNLWFLPFNKSNDAVYEIWVVTPSGKIDSTCKVEPRVESILSPVFDSSTTKKKPLGMANFGLNVSLLLQQQTLVKERMEKREHQKALIQVRQQPFSANRTTKCFQDHEIIQIGEYADIKKVEIANEIFHFYYTYDKKVVFVQIPFAGCLTAASAMLIMDNAKLPVASDLKNREWGTWVSAFLDILNAGLSPRVIPVSASNSSLFFLREQILSDGPAILSIMSNPNGSTGHAVIVDEISKDLLKVRIRDPWHGWSITVDGWTFQRVWHNFINKVPHKAFIVQVKNGAK